MDGYKFGVFYNNSDSINDFNKDIDLDSILRLISELDLNQFYLSNDKKKLIDICKRLVIFSDKALDAKTEHYNNSKTK